MRPGWYDTTSGRVFSWKICGKETECILLMNNLCNSNIATWFLIMQVDEISLVMQIYPFTEDWI